MAKDRMARSLTRLCGISNGPSHGAVGQIRQLNHYKMGAEQPGPCLNLSKHSLLSSGAWLSGPELSSFAKILSLDRWLSPTLRVGCVELNHGDYLLIIWTIQNEFHSLELQIFKFYFIRSWSHGKIEHTTDMWSAQSYAVLIIYINHFMSHMLNVKGRPTPSAVKFDEISYWRG